MWLEDLERIAQEMLEVLEMDEPLSPPFSGFLVGRDELAARWFEAHVDCRSINDLAKGEHE